MNKMKIGVLCPSEIALRRFMPALQKHDDMVFAGVAVADKSEWFGVASDEMISADKAKAEMFVADYGGKVYASYLELIADNDVDCIYIPLPPALHFEWAKKVLENKKHVLLEKPFTTSLSCTQELIKMAEDADLALHENYMFQYHDQIHWICSKLPELGEIRLFRIDFGFPFRGNNDFRYNKSLGGGALIDCGGYTLKLASLLLGETASITDAALAYKCGFDVDICGLATLRNNEGISAQVSFGMDNDYRCSLDVWGSNGSLSTNRVFTAPVGFEPTVTLKNSDGAVDHKLKSDDSFANSIEQFKYCIQNSEARAANAKEILAQARLLEQFVEICTTDH